MLTSADYSSSGSDNRQTGRTGKLVRYYNPSWRNVVPQGPIDLEKLRNTFIKAVGAWRGRAALPEPHG